VRVLLVAPPRRIWPFMNEQDNFLMPQALACVAAVLREGGVEVRVIDCMPQKIGWKSLEAEIRSWRPDVLAAGENHATYASEVSKLVSMAKRVLPKVVVVLGGSHYTNVGELYLGKEPIDFIVRGEGEITMLELVKALESGDPEAPYRVDGLSYFRGGKVIYTRPRDLVANLDDLPMPAYDLMPMSEYGKAKYLFSQGGTTIHHSRGCPASCSFCVWWTQDAKREVTVDEDGCRQEELAPRWRSKSVKRTVEEVELLATKYGKKTLIFTDPTFNVDPKWSAAFADALIEKNLGVQYMAFVRADYLLRDEKLGVLEKLVKSGLSHVCIGVERDENATLSNWDKSFYNSSQSVAAFKLLKEKYPSVFRQGTFIVGTREETPESMRRQLEFARSLDLDYPAFHPMTPFPGTALYDQAKAEGWLELDDFDYFDLSTPVVRSAAMTREQIELGIVALNKSYVGVRWFLRGVTSPHRYRRNMYLWWIMVMARVMGGSLLELANPLDGTRYTGLVKPRWYEL
jgi:anaerobic magnesium-protoporphyrin IX monomethyl ester cyclase